jgi:outer membrane protein assembly factor BamD
VIKGICVLIIFSLILMGCSGKKPQSDWTSEEYYQYAKEKYDDEDYWDASNDFNIVILRFPGSAVADSAQYFLGCSHYYMAEYIISAAEFRKLINNMPRSPLVPDAQYMLGESYYQMSPRAELDQEYTAKAIQEFQMFVEDFPRHVRREEVEKKLVELRDKLARKHLLNADLYRKMHEFRSSIIYYDIVLEQFYDTDFAEDALYGKALAYIDLDDYKKAKEELLTFKDKFPASKLNSKVERKLKELLRRIERESEDSD